MSPGGGWAVGWRSNGGQMAVFGGGRAAFRRLDGDGKAALKIYKLLF
jgi:hypothetical protein